MIDHLRAQPQIDAIGGVREQEGAQSPDHTLHQGDDNQGHPQDLQRVQAALGDHLVDNHLNQQGVGQAEQLHHERGQQHLQKQAPVAAEGGPEPTGPEALLRCADAAFKQQHLHPLGVGLCQPFGAELHPAIGR